MDNKTLFTAAAKLSEQHPDWELVVDTREGDSRIHMFQYSVCIDIAAYLWCERRRPGEMAIDVTLSHEGNSATISVNSRYWCKEDDDVIGEICIAVNCVLENKVSRLIFDELLDEEE